MAKTPVVMKVADYKDREVQMVTYEFDQEIDREGQMTGIPRGGKIRVRVKALNDLHCRGDRCDTTHHGSADYPFELRFGARFQMCPFRNHQPCEGRGRGVPLHR